MAVFHPGGTELTEHMLSLQPLSPGARVLDIGCGDGETVRMLRNRYHLDAAGIEANPQLCLQDNVMHGFAEALPQESGTADGVLLECVLSRVSAPETAAAECFRVLKSGGLLYISDLTAGAEERLLLPAHPDTGCIGRLETAARQKERMERLGFVLLHEENRDEDLISYFAELLFSGADAPAGLSKEERRRLKPGYSLWIWEKP